MMRHDLLLSGVCTLQCAGSEYLTVLQQNQPFADYCMTPERVIFRVEPAPKGVPVIMSLVVNLSGGHRHETSPNGSVGAGLLLVCCTWHRQCGRDHAFRRPEFPGSEYDFEGRSREFGSNGFQRPYLLDYCQGRR